MTEEQKKRKAERDRRYREKKKQEKVAEENLQASPSVMELLEGQEQFREEFKGVPAKPERELTPFELLKRRRERYS